MDAAGSDLGRLDHYLSVDHPLKRALQAPEELVDALQDRVHLDVGNARAAKSVKVQYERVNADVKLNAECKL